MTVSICLHVYVYLHAGETLVEIKILTQNCFHCIDMQRRQNIFLSILLDDEGFYVFGHDHVGHGKSDGRRKIINISISLN